MNHVVEGFVESGRFADALTEAARWGETDMVRALLEKGIAVDAKGQNGATALMVAASGGKLRIVRLLLTRGADVNATDDIKGNTPVMWCLRALHSERTYEAILGELLHAGADVTVRAKDGRAALDLARERKSDKLVALLEAHMN